MIFFEDRLFFYSRSKFTNKCNFFVFDIFCSYLYTVICIIEPYESFKKSYHGASYL